LGGIGRSISRLSIAALLLLGAMVLTPTGSIIGVRSPTKYVHTAVWDVIRCQEVEPSKDLLHTTPTPLPNFK